MAEIILPEIGEGVKEGELQEWLVKKGDTLQVDQSVAEVLTDKAVVEIPSPIAGVVESLKFQKGDTIPVGSVLLHVDVSDVSQDSSFAAKEREKNNVSQEKINNTTQDSLKQSTSLKAEKTPRADFLASLQSKTVKDIHPPRAFSHVLATPSTRRLARELDVDINQIRGTGLAHRVTREDIMNFQKNISSNRDFVPPHFEKKSFQEGIFTFDKDSREKREPLIGLRRKIAQKMQTTKKIVPHFSLMDEAQVERLVCMREEIKEIGETQGIKVTYLPFIMKALLFCLRQFPLFNASLDDEKQEIVYKNYFNIGFACDTPQGLLVPVVKDVDYKNILQLSQEIISLSEKARQGQLTREQMSSATISITNIGSIGGCYATPIINHPEVAILGMYKITTKPVWENSQWKPSSVMSFSLTCDHRLIDGAQAAYFLKKFINKIEKPSQLLWESL